MSSRSGLVENLSFRLPWQTEFLVPGTSCFPKVSDSGVPRTSCWATTYICVCACVYGNCTCMAVDAKICTLHSLWKFLWKASFRMLFCISLKNLRGQRLAMPHQVPSITIGSHQEEDGFLVMKLWIPRRGESWSWTSALHPGKCTSIFLSFPPSHSMSFVTLSDATATLDQMKTTGMRCPCPSQTMGFSASPSRVFLSTSAFSEELCEFRQQFLLLRIKVASREDVINSHFLCAGSSSLAVHTCFAHQEIPSPPLSYIMKKSQSLPPHKQSA